MYKYSLLTADYIGCLKMGPIPKSLIMTINAENMRGGKVTRNLGRESNLHFPKEGLHVLV